MPVVSLSNRTPAHQNEIKPKQAYFHSLCEIYKLTPTPFTAFELSSLPPLLNWSLFDRNSVV